MAGPLGVSPGGRNVYLGRNEAPPVLGHGPRPSGEHLRRAARLSGAVGAGALGVAVATALLRGAVLGRRSDLRGVVLGRRSDLRGPVLGWRRNLRGAVLGRREDGTGGGRR